MLKKRIAIPVIPYHFYLNIFETAEDMKVVWQGKVEEDSLDCPGFVTTYLGQDYLIIVDDDRFRYSYIVHESNHILSNAFNWIGQRLDGNNDEIQTYFLQYIFEKVDYHYQKFHKKHQISTKN